MSDQIPTKDLKKRATISVEKEDLEKLKKLAKEHAKGNLSAYLVYVGLHFYDK